jgi:hypothetical protein
MTNPWDRAEEALVALEQRTQYDERNRLELLFVHAMKGMAVGVLMAAYGPPDAWLLEFGTHSAFFLWAPALVGGIALMAGLLWNRNILLEAIGMMSLIAWDCLMIYTLGKSGTNPYALGVYAGVAGLMFIHLRTLWRYLRARTEVLHDE